MQYNDFKEWLCQSLRKEERNSLTIYTGVFKLLGLGENLYVSYISQALLFQCCLVPSMGTSTCRLALPS